MEVPGDTVAVPQAGGDVAQRDSRGFFMINAG
jgi:hypothetical protein